ncbi:MAG: ATP-binding cassette domain-containing protein [Chitinivibrionales bacterium]|nr:ATP-binding cassette domain-containing protein [Chitinivibrionales bacterium]MBD3397086.1 ATP-binding cassette domain-containing protein [Chitinivibrionales bacterium]
MSPVVAFRNVCFSYTDTEVLHDVSFSVEPGSFVGVVGPNGGGKTTLLRLILGLEKPDKGGISVFGGDPQHARHRIGYMTQHMLYDERFPATVLDIALMGRAGRHAWGPYTVEDRRAARDALSRVGMAAGESRPFASLSGGQQQRVLIAQALAVEPEVLLLDEPTANVDIEGEGAIHELLDSLANTLTVISVSHNVNTVLRSVSHVMCVNRTIAMSRLDDLNPETLTRARGGDIAVLHHELNCRVFDKSHGDSCDSPHAPGA